MKNELILTFSEFIIGLILVYIFKVFFEETITGNQLVTF